MRHSLFTLIILLLTISNAVAQENKAPEQKPTTPTTTESEKPKNEVELMLEDAAKRGEKILATCPVKDCDEPSLESGVEKGRAVQLPKPAYPTLARMGHAEGTVKVMVIIGEEGTVIRAAAIDGHPLLFAASVAAAREAVFSPTRLHGKPVKVVGVIEYNFVAQ